MESMRQADESAEDLPSGPTVVPSPGASGHRGRLGRLRLAAAVVFLLSGSALAIDAFLIEPQWIETVRSVVQLPALRASAPDVTLVHLTDLHIARFGPRERRAVAIVNDARPDLIVVTGDLEKGRAPAAALEQFLSSLRARSGVYVVWGNHDHWSRTATTWGPDVVKRAGCTLLRNSSRTVRTPAGPIHLAGVDDPVTGHDNLGLAMAGVPRRDVSILLSHTPAIADHLGNWDIDLVLAGHTHGGQIRLPGIGALWLPAGVRGREEGWFDADAGARLHVSRGLGTSWLPARFFCRPRIDIIALRGGPPRARAARGTFPS